VYGYCARPSGASAREVNTAHVAVRWLGIAGIVVAIAAYFIPGVQLDVYASIIGVFYLVGVSITVVRSFHFLRTLTADEPDSPSHHV